MDKARFCHSCGSSLDTAVTHAEYKQVTVLFADVVHSMDLAAAVGAERLREIMAELVNRSVTVVRRYGGTVDKFTGDGIMAVFGAPVALEDHAVRACFAALGIQEQASELALAVQHSDHETFDLRVGLNSGQVIAGEVASRALGYTAMGEHVGLAQRMESAAHPGGVMLSESTARLVAHAAVLGEPETVDVKGPAEPMRAYRLFGMEAPHAITGQGESPLVGRRWETAAVEANLERSIAGDGTVVTIVGPAGIGKSRMVREFAAAANARGAEVDWAFCESHTSDIPFHAVGQLLRAVLGLAGLDAGPARRRLRERFEGADEQDLVLLDDLLGIHDPGSTLPAVDPDARRRRLSALVKAAAIARTTPAVYIVEDVQWIDEVSDAMLADFLTVVPQTNAMVLLTHRPEFRGILTLVPGTQTLTLAPLSRSEAAELAAQLLGSDPSVSGLATRITERAAGNPFFTEEIVRDLSERGVLIGQRGAYACRQEAEEISVPGTLQATIAARIDRLAPQAKHALCAAAVIGMRFDAELLAVMGVECDLDELVQAELVAQVRFTGHAEYVFRQPLIRAVAYESQLKSDRAELHRRLVDVMTSREESVDEDAALIADHLEAAGDIRNAYAWRMRAAASSRSRDVAAALVSWEHAARLADQLPDNEPDRLTLRIAPRTLWCANGFRMNRSVAGERFEELQDLCAAAGDKASVAMATMGLVGELLQKGQTKEASRQAGDLMALIESIADPALTVGLGVGPMAIKIMTGEMKDVLRWADLVIDLAKGDRELGGFIVGSPLAMAHSIRSSARWWLGEPGWRDDFDRALALAHDADPITRAAVNTYTYYNGIGSGIVDVDDTAMREINECLDLAELSADDIALALALFTKSNALHQNPAQWERELELLGRVREMATGGRFYPSMVAAVDARVAEIMIRRGHRECIADLRSSIDELYSSGQVGYCVWATGVLVRALTTNGTEDDIDEAEAAIDRLARQSVFAESAFCDLVLLQCRALIARARHDDAACRDLTTRYLDLATSLEYQGHIAIAEQMVAGGA
ncbi:MAG TPA: adenylate/guanylate cyclase domain-containing protein [Mycobacterium sp.]|nr:adenylate/guanylate cyclase domain-containing protein [Mycobacterium sp.]